MQVAKKCPECGEALPPDAPAGHCPSCLLRIGLAIADGGLARGLEHDDGDVQHRHAENSASPPRIRYIGDYELLAEVAHGGMGVIYRARQTSLNRLVALKLIRTGELANPGEVSRFRAEAEAAASLDHPNIVPIYEVGEQDGRHYFSMRLIEGGSLSERIARAPMPNREAATLLATVAHAVHYAHQRGLLHRDLKPGNILIDNQGQPHVTDFGLAKRIESDSSMTLSGAIVGTPSYVSPEQAAGARQLTTATDIYSLGAILYELLSGQPPFKGATVIETLRKVTNEDPVLPSALRQNVDADLETICLKCLEKDADHRYGSAEALAEDLERWWHHEPIRARPTTAVDRFGKWTHRNPVLAGSIAAIFFVAVVGLSGIVWQWRSAVAANRRAAQANNDLWQASYLGARYWTHSGLVGQRTNALAIVRTAAALRPSLELRNEALTALLLPDFGPQRWWKEESNFWHPLAYDSDLEHYVPHDGAGRVLVRRAGDHQIVQDLGKFRPAMSCALFSPNDRYIAAEFDRNRIARVWDWRAGVLLAEVPCHRFDWGAVPFCFSPDSREFIYGDDKTGVRRLELANGKALAPLFTNHLVDMVRVSPSGRRLLVTQGNDIEAWDLTRHRRIAAAKVNFAYQKILDASWHPNDEIVALGGEGGGFLWFLPSGNLRPVGEANMVLMSVFFNRTGDLLFLGGQNNYCEVWDVASHERILGSKGSPGRPLALSRNGSRLAVDREKTGFGVLDFLPPVGVRKLISSLPLAGAARVADLHPNNRWLLAGGQIGWTLWNAESGQLLARDSDSGLRESFTDVRFSPDGSAFYTCDSRGLRRWPFEESQKSNPESELIVGRPETIGLPNGSTNSDHAFKCEGGYISANGRYAALFGSGRVMLFSLETRAIFPAVPLQNPWDNIMAISPDGTWLATTHNNQHGGPDIYNLREGRHVQRLARAELAGFVWETRSGELLTQSTVEAIFWQPAAWTINRRLPWQHPGLGAGFMGFTPDGQTGWLSGSDGTLQFLNLKENRPYATVQYPIQPHGSSVTFDSAHQRAFMTHNGGITMWDLAEVRRNLAALGLDWPDDRPFEFAPRRP